MCFFGGLTDLRKCGFAVKTYFELAMASIVTIAAP